jgi:hypothetical protein
MPHQKVLLAWKFVTTYFGETSYRSRNDIDAVASFDIIRWHLARQATLAAVVETAGYVLP